MQIIQQKSLLKPLIEQWRNEQKVIALVPTMGNLHAGHMSLIKLARAHADKVVTTLFVNPLQFSQTEDLDNYPRTLEDDSNRLKQHGCDCLFAPSIEEMYPRNTAHYTTVSLPQLTQSYCGEHRPGHFTGVATVVVKLFNLIPANYAVFGEKDYQQLLLVKQLVHDLNFPIEIIAAPTVRSSDGLAMSSRNQYLTEQELSIAPGLYSTLCYVRDSIIEGNKDFEKLEIDAKKNLVEIGFKPDYFSICHRDTLSPAKETDKTLIILTAAHLGKARLIDNIAFNI